MEGGISRYGYLNDFRHCYDDVSSMNVRHHDHCRLYRPEVELTMANFISLTCPEILFVAHIPKIVVSPSLDFRCALAVATTSSSLRGTNLRAVLPLVRPSIHRIRSIIIQIISYSINSRSICEIIFEYLHNPT